MSTKHVKGSEPQRLPTKRGAEVMAKLMASFQKVDLKSKETEMNEYSMDDNNGRRIIYLVINGKSYAFIGNRKKRLELLKLVDGQLKPVSVKKKPTRPRRRLASK